VDAIIIESVPILKLLDSPEQTLLVRWNAFLVLDLLLDTLNRVRTLHSQNNSLASQCLHEDLHGWWDLLRLLYLPFLHVCGFLANCFAHTTYWFSSWVEHSAHVAVPWWCSIAPKRRRHLLNRPTLLIRLPLVSYVCCSMHRLTFEWKNTILIRLSNIGTLQPCQHWQTLSVTDRHTHTHSRATVVCVSEHREKERQIIICKSPNY